MTDPAPPRPPDGASGEPGPRPRARHGQALARPGGGPARSWLGWARDEPVLAAALLAFCLVAVVGLVWSLPRGTISGPRAQRVGGDVAGTQPHRPPAPAKPAAPKAPEPPSARAPSAEPATPGPWVEEPASAPSPRGLGLVYFHRTLPPDGEPRYEWVVRLRGARPVVDGVDQVTWRMDPPAKNGADFVSQDRAADGFPLFGHGPGGWFGVSALVRHKDGGEETLVHRIEFPE